MSDGIYNVVLGYVLESQTNSDKSIHTNDIKVGNELELRIAWFTTWNFYYSKDKLRNVNH